MANEDNLRGAYSPSEARENGSKGGKASAASKRRKKEFRDVFQALLDGRDIKGPEGNIEYLMHIQKNPLKAREVMVLSEKEAEDILETIMAERTGITYTAAWDDQIREIVEKAHGQLDKPE